jgi:enoyl-CoA hydratase/carnithine racemase
VEYIQTLRDRHVLVARLSHGKANTLTTAVLQELDLLIEQVAEDDDLRSLVLASDVAGFFSAGFDIGQVFRYDGEEMQTFFGKFIDVYEGLQRLPKVVVAAVTGHAYAGGAVLAIASDWRVMTDGPSGFALNEVKIGISMPPGIARMVVNLLGAGYARQMLLLGDPLGPEDAFRVGLVNELAPQNEVLDRSIARAHQFAENPPATLAAIKHQLGEVTGMSGQSDRDLLDAFIAEWDTDESRSARRTLLESMAR